MEIKGEVVQSGADIGIKCLGCGRRAMLERRKFESKVKGIIRPNEGSH